MSDTTMTAPPPPQQQRVGEGYVEGRGKEDYNGGDHRADVDQEFLEMRDPEPQKETESNRNTPPLSFMFGETSVFRDFLLSAFSDGYNSVGSMPADLATCCCFYVSRHSLCFSPNFL